MNLLNRKHLANQPRRILSCHTRDFIQKICYKKTASVDMTQHGFICDSKTQPVKLLVSTLKTQLEKICDPEKSKKNCKMRKDYRKKSIQQEKPKRIVPKNKKKVNFK